MTEAGLFASPIISSAKGARGPTIAAIHNHSFGDLLRSLAIAPASGRNHPLEAAREEMLKFERREIEFRKKDRAERAADLHLPLDETRVH